METIRFQDVTLTKEVEKAISDMGFEEMTPIQAMTIPPILEGKDIVGQAQTGTGKTIAFAIPIIEAVKQRSKRTHAIVLCPTRELAIQVSEEIKRVAKYRKDIRVLPVYGGQPIDRQLARAQGRRPYSDRDAGADYRPHKPGHIEARQRQDRRSGRGRRDAEHGVHGRCGDYPRGGPCRQADAPLLRHHAQTDTQRHKTLYERRGVHQGRA